MNGDESMNQDKIDKNIPTPLYYQLLQILKSQIETGRLEPGDVIPTEKELMEKYEISRATVRQAVLQLVNDGYLRREKSKGTFVTKPASKFRFIEGLRGFSAEMRDRNIPYQSKVLEKRVISAEGRSASIEQRSSEALPEDQVIRIGRLEVNRSSYTVRLGKREVFFPRKEFELLSLLASHPGRVFSRETLLNQVWGNDVVVVDRTVDVHISKIREKLVDDVAVIETIKGVGYRLKV